MDLGETLLRCTLCIRIQGLLEDDDIGDIDIEPPFLEDATLKIGSKKILCWVGVG